MYKVGRLRLNQGRKLCNPSKENPFLLCAVSGIKEHEGTEVEVARVEFHFIANPQSQAAVENNIAYYTSTPYNFYNKAVDAAAGSKQATMIVRDGDTLESIEAPRSIEGASFFGWYIVDVADDHSAYNASTHIYEGSIRFS